MQTDRKPPDEEADNTPNPPSIWRLDWPTLGFSYSAVYVIAPRSGWPVKIGISAVAQKRLAALQTSHWSRLDIYHYWLCENAATARKVEKAAHKLLTKDNRLMNGEWFDIRAHQAPQVIGYLAEKLGVELVTEIPDIEKFQKVHDRLEELEEQDYRRGQIVHDKRFAREQANTAPVPYAQIYAKLPDSMFKESGPRFNGRVTERRMRKSSAH